MPNNTRRGVRFVLVTSLVLCLFHLIDDSQRLKIASENNYDWQQQVTSEVSSSNATDSNNKEGVENLDCCHPNNKRCDWWEAKYWWEAKSKQTEIPKCEKENLLSMLRWLNRVLTSENVQWMITAGTLLGAVRNQGHIPFETDIDIQVRVDQLTKLKKVVNDHIQNDETVHFHLKSWTWGERLYFSKKNEIHVDIWPYMPAPNNATREVMPGKKEVVWYLVDNEVLFPLAECEYEGDFYPCLRQQERYLELRYGSEWNIPKPKYTSKPTYKDGDGAGLLQGKGIPEWKHSCTTFGKQDAWAKKSAPNQEGKFPIFREMIQMFDQFKNWCPYQITGTTMYGFVHKCDLMGAPLKFAIPLPWWVANHQALHEAMIKRHFTPGGHHGTLGQLGYNAFWTKGRVKIHLMSIVLHQDHYEWGLWLPNIKTAVTCIVNSSNVGEFLFDDLSVRVPTPFDSALGSYFGKSWRTLDITKVTENTIFKDSGSCKR